MCGDGSFCPEEYPAGAWRAVGRCFADRLCPRCRGGSDAGTFRLRAGHSAGGVPVFGGFGIPGGGARGRGTGGPPFRGDAILLPAACGCGAGPADELDRGVSCRGQNAGRAAAAGGPYRAGNGGSGPGADLQRAGLYGRGGGRPHFRLHGGGDFFVPVPAGGGWGHGPMRFSGTTAAGTAVFAAVRRTGGLRTGAGTVGRITHGTAAPHLSGRDELAAAAGRCTLLLFAAASAAGARGTPWRRRTIEDHHICLRTKADRHGAA